MGVEQQDRRILVDIHGVLLNRADGKDPHYVKNSLNEKVMDRASKIAPTVQPGDDRLALQEAIRDILEERDRSWAFLTVTSPPPTTHDRLLEPYYRHRYFKGYEAVGSEIEAMAQLAGRERITLLSGIPHKAWPLVRKWVGPQVCDQALDSDFSALLRTSERVPSCDFKFACCAVLSRVTDLVMAEDDYYNARNLSALPRLLSAQFNIRVLMPHGKIAVENQPHLRTLKFPPGVMEWVKEQQPIEYRSNLQTLLTEPSLDIQTPFCYT